MVKVLLKYKEKAKEASFTTDDEFWRLLPVLFGIDDPTSTVRVSQCSAVRPDELLDVDSPAEVDNHSKLIISDVAVSGDSVSLSRR